MSYGETKSYSLVSQIIFRNDNLPKTITKKISLFFNSVSNIVNVRIRLFLES